MTVDASLQQVRDPSVTESNALQIPVYIGMATKKVAVSIKPGSFSLAIPHAEEGLKYIDASMDGSITYWASIAKFIISEISQDRKTITVLQQSIDTDISILGLIGAFVFFVNDEKVVYAAKIANIKYKIDNGKLIVQKLFFDVMVPTISNTTKITIAKIKKITDFSFSERNGTVTIDKPSDIFFIDTVENSIISCDLNFYFKIVDFRIITLNYNDDISPYEDSSHGSLGRCIQKHRSMSATPFTIATIPSETLGNITDCISIIAIDPNKYGYMLVPMCDVSVYGNLLTDFVESLDIEFTNSFMQSYQWMELPIEKILLDGLKPISSENG